MIPITNPQVAAQLALGLNPQESPAHRSRTLFREALEARNYAPFRLGTISFQLHVPAAAAINIMRHFNGSAMPWVGAATEEPVFDGFHRRDGDGSLFHRNSLDFEDACEQIADRGLEVRNMLIEAGVNPVETLHPLTLGETTSLILCGTLVDFFELFSCVAPFERNAHPSARTFAREAWDHIRAHYPIAAGAFEEANP